VGTAAYNRSRPANPILSQIRGLGPNNLYPRQCAVETIDVDGMLSETLKRNLNIWAALGMAITACGCYTDVVSRDNLVTVYSSGYLIHGGGYQTMVVKGRSYHHLSSHGYITIPEKQAIAFLTQNLSGTTQFHLVPIGKGKEISFNLGVTSLPIGFGDPKEKGNACYVETIEGNRITFVMDFETRVRNGTKEAGRAIVDLNARTFAENFGIRHYRLRFKNVEYDNALGRVYVPLDEFNSVLFATRPEPGQTVLHVVPNGKGEEITVDAGATSFGDGLGVNKDNPDSDYVERVTGMQIFLISKRGAGSPPVHYLLDLETRAFKELGG
jgi:hypothetical protein